MHFWTWTLRIYFLWGVVLGVKCSDEARSINDVYFRFRFRFIVRRNSHPVKMPLFNRDLFSKLRESKFEPDSELKTIILAQKNLSLENLDDAQIASLDAHLKLFLKNAKKKWQDSDRSQARMEKRCGRYGQSTTR